MEYLILSNFDTHLFLEKYKDSDTVPESGANELKSVLPFTLPNVTKDVARYRTLDGNGWESLAALGQAQGDATLNFLRAGTGDAFTGEAAASTYSILKSWALSNAETGGQAVPKCLILVRPRSFDKTTYEGVCYYVLPSSFDDGEAGENGQEFSVTVSPFGPPVPLVVTKGTGNTFTFTKAS